MKKAGIPALFALVGLFCLTLAIGCKKNLSQPSFSGIYYAYDTIGDVDGRITLDFLNGHQVTVLGDAFAGNVYISPDTMTYDLTKNQNLSFIHFYYDVAGVKDSIVFYYEFNSQGGFLLTTCPPGFFCPARVWYYNFTR